MNEYDQPLLIDHEASLLPLQGTLIYLNTMKQLMLIFNGLIFSSVFLLPCQFSENANLESHNFQRRNILRSETLIQRRNLLNSNAEINKKTDPYYKSWMPAEMHPDSVLSDRPVHINAEYEIVQDSTIDTKNTSSYLAINRRIQAVKENEKLVIRFNEAPKEGLAWLKGTDFSEGIIEFDAKGRDLLQKSFIGVAFHGTDNKTYEAVYFRLFNFQSADPVRKVHAVQYISVPQFDFETLRETRKDEFESAVLPSNIQATEWFHVKIEILKGRVKVYLNNSPEPCLDVSSLNPKVRTGKVGLWVGNNSNGDFANFSLRK